MSYVQHNISSAYKYLKFALVLTSLYLFTYLNFVSFDGVRDAEVCTANSTQDWRSEEDERCVHGRKDWFFCAASLSCSAEWTAKLWLLSYYMILSVVLTAFHYEHNTTRCFSMITFFATIGGYSCLWVILSNVQFSMTSSVTVAVLIDFLMHCQDSRRAFIVLVVRICRRGVIFTLELRRCRGSDSKAHSPSIITMRCSWIYWSLKISGIRFINHKLALKTWICTAQM